MMKKKLKKGGRAIGIFVALIRSAAQLLSRRALFCGESSRISLSARVYEGQRIKLNEFE